MKTQTLTRTLRLAGCIRVSDERGRAGKDNFYSPIEQRATIERSIPPGAEIVDWIELIDVSSNEGKNFEHPEFLRVLALIKAGHLDGVLVAKYDRFGRDMRSSLNMIDEIETAGGVVIGEVNADDAPGELGRNTFLLIGNYVLRQITENWIDVHDRRHEKGLHHGPVPCGYELIEGKIHPHPIHGETMAWAFEQRATGVGVTELLRLCQERDQDFPINTRQGLSVALRNRAYLGEIHTARTSKHSKKRSARPPVLDAHTPLTTVITFEACQGPKTKSWTRSETGYLLGRVRCATCRRSMPINNAKANDVTTSYQCRHEQCHARAGVQVAKLDRYAERKLLERLESIQFQASQLSPDLADLEAALLTATNDVRLWMQNTTAQAADITLWNEELSRRNAVKEATGRALRDEQMKAGLVNGLPEATTFGAAYEQASPLERRDIYSRMIDVVFVRPSGQGLRLPIEERVKILWDGDAPEYRKKRQLGAVEPYTW